MEQSEVIRLIISPSEPIVLPSTSLRTGSRGNYINACVTLASPVSFGASINRPPNWFRCVIFDPPKRSSGVNDKIEEKIRDHRQIFTQVSVRRPLYHGMGSCWETSWSALPFRESWYWFWGRLRKLFCVTMG